MGHYPPRPQDLESRQESPPTAFVDIHSANNTSGTIMTAENWNDLSHQFEESVGKPSREALHKFFYPPGNAAGPTSPPSQRRRVTSKARLSLSTTEDRGSDRSLGGGFKKKTAPSPSSQSSTERSEPPRASVRQTRVPEPPFSIDDDEKEIAEQQQAHHPNEPSQPASASSIHRRSHPDDLAPPPPNDDDHDWHSSQSPSPPSSFSPPTVSFTRSFDVQEEEDQKYVERFWTIYDDIIMLSLFTQLGVIARLAASTWFTVFDGVFRHDSPLFTNLPLNCLSCFLLGLLGSGDRLMEMISTRFTPRNLQQRIVRHESDDDDNDDNANDDMIEDNDSRHGYAYDHDNDSEGGGNRDNNEGLRRRNHRPKRAKKRTKATFHSWQPPIHWHDDLREVQLLALERRIRASKCLILFPVMKEDADVMEHYFGEGYKASNVRKEQNKKQPQQGHPVQNGGRRRRNRRRFGRKKYDATRLADGDDDLFQQGSYSGSGDCYDEDDFDDNDDDDVNHYGHDSRNYNYENDEEDTALEDDGRFRFDLKLTPSMERAKESDAKDSSSPVAAADPKRNAAAASSPTSMPPSIQKLIKRAPGLSTSPSRTTTENNGPTSPPTTGAVAPSMAPASAMQAQPTGPTITAQSHARQAPVVDETITHQQQTTQAPPRQPQPTSPPNTSFVAGAVATLAGASPEIQARTHSAGSDSDHRSLGTASGGEGEDPQLEQIISNVQANVSENINRMRRVNIADGWDVGTTPESMADDLMLGLRDGFCGALSSFSSWNSAMLDLLREGHIGEAFVGYLLGLQLPIVAYRFGQQVAVYYFVWRCRREARREERKGGYGIRIKMDDDDEDDSDNPLASSSVDDCFDDEVKSAETSLDEVQSPEIPSVRAICTALFLLGFVMQCTSLNFFSDPQDQQIALSLLFSPVGSLARWRLSQFNNWRPGFPIGTFACNILACALSGSLGGLLAGNPGPKERILLQSVVAGFGGTLSSLATFIVEVLAGMDPLLFRFDGVIYAVCSIMWALIVGFVFSASVDWADETS